MDIASQVFFISPLLVISGGAFLLLLLEVFLFERCPRELVTVGTLAVALFLGIFSSSTLSGTAVAPQDVTIMQGMFFADYYSWFASVLIIGTSLFCALLLLGTLSKEGIEAPGEFYSLYLMTTAGAIVLVVSAEFITLFLGLEIMSMAAYCLTGSVTSPKRAFFERISAEASLKYFLLGSFSSAFMLYGLAFLYGLSGTTFIPDVGSMVAVSGLSASPILFLAVGLIVAGMLFKIGAVPFHFWTPDVYQGAPTGVTAFMASVIKSASVLMMLRFLWLGFGSSSTGHMPQIWIGALWLCSALTMIVGNVIAVRQVNVKRMLSYSSIAHAGYMLMAFLLPSEGQDAAAAVLFYLVCYCIMTLGSFGVLLSLDTNDESPQYQYSLERFRGLGVTRPFLAAAMTLFLLSLAGLPPGLAGLLGKFYLFSEVVRGQFFGLAIIGVLSSAVSCYFYLRVIVAMYFHQPDSDRQTIAPRAGIGVSFALTACAVAILFLGIFPGGLYSLAVEVTRGLVA